MERLIKEFNYQSSVKDKNVHFVEGYQIIYVISGSLDLLIDEKPYHAEAPSAILLNPFEKYRVENVSEDYLRFVLVINAIKLENELDPKIITMLKYRPEQFVHTVDLKRDTVFHINRIFSILSDELSNYQAFRDELLELEVRHLLILLYRNYDIEQTDTLESIIAVQKYIDNNFMKIEDVKNIADLFFISTSYLSHSFKENTGYSPKEYLTQTRLYHAQQYLSYTDYNITSICNLIGYNDVNNFIRQFRLKYGMPPLQFRKTHSKYRAYDLINSGTKTKRRHKRQPVIKSGDNENDNGMPQD